jgi:hypothetical protein
VIGSCLLWAVYTYIPSSEAFLGSPKVKAVQIQPLFFLKCGYSIFRLPIVSSAVGATQLISQRNTADKGFNFLRGIVRHSAPVQLIPMSLDFQLK